MKISRHVIQALCVLGLWLGWGLQAHAQTDTVTYVYTDPQGTPLVEADAQGNVIARYDYTPYGNAVASLGSAPNGPGYTGHVNDPETGLVYMQARYYQPDGRFLSPDPVIQTPGDLSSFNRYVYANNNPIMNIDRDGRQSTNDSVPLVAVQDSNGQVMMVPAADAGQSLAAVQTGSNISDITNPSLDKRAAADALNNAQLVLAVGTIRFPQAAEYTGPVDLGAGMLALALDPNWERVANVFTLGGFRGLELTAHGTPAALKAISRADTASTFFDVAKAAKEHYDKIAQEKRQQQREQEEQQRERKHQQEQ